MYKNSTLLAFLIFSIAFSSSFYSFGQPVPSSPDNRMKAFEQRKDLRKKSLTYQMNFRNVGPSIFGGRVTDIEVNPKNTNHFYVAYASGGLWETKNNGSTFTPLFDKQAVMTIGDIAVNWEDDIIYVGTGECNSSRSSYAGMGIYRSEDNGKTWDHLGLEDSHHIARIVLDKTDPDNILVAVTGHLYSDNLQRGIFLSENGGKSWEKTLFINKKTGGIDLVQDPTNPRIFYAAMWKRERKAWDFVEGGNGSGVYKSLDSGKSWTEYSTALPTGENLGRIGLDAVEHNGKTILYALIDNHLRREPDSTQSEKGLTTKALKGMSPLTFINTEDSVINKYLTQNNFPTKFQADTLKKLIRNKTYTIEDLVNYTGSANTDLFDTEIIGAELYRSENAAISWEKTHDIFLDGLYYTYGYYFGQVRAISKDELYIMGVPVMKSIDGGKTFTNINHENVHVDHHAMWINPKNSDHVILGNDGGINISYDAGDTWINAVSPPMGQFYTVAYDMEKPFNIYGGTQDNGVWKGSSRYRRNRSWMNTGEYPYERIMGGDGMQIEIDNRNPKVTITGFQFGNYFRITDEGADKIQTQHELGEKPYRFNWQTPIHLSNHQNDIFYMGSQYVMRSFSQGEDIEPISEDLTDGKVKGNVPYGTLTSIHESSLVPGKIAAGSDDGNIYVSPDAGYSWEKVSTNLPQKLKITEVVFSQHAENRLYASLNGYHWDHFAPYLYVSNDNGKNWKNISSGLPNEPINAICEDPVNENILYIGTDHQTYLSMDMGKTFTVLSGSVPDVAVHDLAIHPRDHKLLIGTHGRSIYMGDIKDVRKLYDRQNVQNPSDSLIVLEQPKVRYNENWGVNPSLWNVDNPLDSFSLSTISLLEDIDEIDIEISYDGEVFYSAEIPVSRGINYLRIPLHFPEQKVKKKYLKQSDDGHYYLQPGKYNIKLDNGERIAQTKLSVYNEE